MVRSVDDECRGFIDKFRNPNQLEKYLHSLVFLNYQRTFSWTFNFMSFVRLRRKSKNCSLCRGLKHHENFVQSYAFAWFKNWCNFFVLKFCSWVVSLFSQQRVILLLPQIFRILSQNPLKNLILLEKCLQLANRIPTPTSQCPHFTLSFMNRVFRSCDKKLQFFD